MYFHEMLPKPSPSVLFSVNVAAVVGHTFGHACPVVSPALSAVTMFPAAFVVACTR